MKAAVLHALEAPSYEGFAEPTPNKDETLVRVRAASLKNSDKMMADGSHYDSLRRLPAVVGLDGVGVLEDGTRVYCAGPRPPYGTMAEKTVVGVGTSFAPTGTRRHRRLHGSSSRLRRRNTVRIAPPRVSGA